MHQRRLCGQLSELAPEVGLLPVELGSFPSEPFQVTSALVSCGILSRLFSNERCHLSIRLDPNMSLLMVASNSPCPGTKLEPASTRDAMTHQEITSRVSLSLIWEFNAFEFSRLSLLSHLCFTVLCSTFRSGNQIRRVNLDSSLTHYSKRLESTPSPQDIRES
jgi:hypothetical protein